VLKTVSDKITNDWSKKYALNMTSGATGNTTVAVRSLIENVAPTVCGVMASVPGTEDGRGDLFEITVTLKNDILGLGLFRFDLQGKATAVLEPYGN
jgi:hypothetical protein